MKQSERPLLFKIAMELSSIQEMLHELQMLTERLSIDNLTEEEIGKIEAAAISLSKVS